MLDQLLLARDENTFATARESGFAFFTQHFSDADWAWDVTRQPYSSTNYNTIWNNEMRAGVRNRLTEAGKSMGDYAAWLGDTHWVRALAYSKHLFSDGYRDNIGWRVVALGIPPAKVVVFGLASHYQNAQNHNQLGRVSNLFFRHIQTLCESRSRPMVGRPVRPDDWDRQGLFPAPISHAAGVDMSDVDADAPGIWLKDMRITTLKRTLASFITVQAISPSDTFSDEAGAILRELEALGSLLLGPA